MNRGLSLQVNRSSKLGFSISKTHNVCTKPVTNHMLREKIHGTFVVTKQAGLKIKGWFMTLRKSVDDVQQGKERVKHFHMRQDSLP